MMRCDVRILLPSVFFVASILFAHPLWSQAGAEDQPSQREFGGTYDVLDPPQRRLVDDWVRRFNEITGKDAPTDVLYNLIRLSERTTFDAVTQALMTTELTDASGQSLGTALDLVSQVETVHGKLKGARGDHQFRMYVVLKPDARDILERCQEFERKKDNTVYHKGYPLNYRGSGGTPSIQISIARETTRADIDVDYRSSSFPTALFNGHLTSSNSDVRAGNNYDRHVNRWGGLQAWWQGLFGFPLGPSGDDDVEAAEGVIPSEPPAGRGDFEDVVHDFLSSWLVDDRANVAASYLSERAYECLQLEQEDPVDYGMAPFALMTAMADIRAALGRPSSLEEAAIGVRLVEPGLRVVESPHHAQVVLYRVSDELAASFECKSRTVAVVRPPSDRPPRFGGYYGSIFYVRGPVTGSTVALLWEKEGGVWKIVSYELEPEGEDPHVPDIRPTANVEVGRTEGDDRFISVTEDFHRSWLIDKDIDRAFAHISPRAYSCYDLLRGDDEPEASSTEHASRLIRAAMVRMGDEIPGVSSLEEIIQGVDVADPQLVVVTHQNETAYTLAAAPDAMGEAFDCARRTRGEPFSDEGIGAQTFGNYFATAFQLHLDRGDGATLVLGWTREDGQWKIFSYDVETP